MAAKTAAELAAKDPRLKAMLAELGSARLDDLPMEDGEVGKRGQDSRFYTHPPNLSGAASSAVPKVPTKSAWAKAIQRGDFDDDDAAQVSGMDSMADGQLARARRIQAAARTAYNYTTENLGSNIRRDRNGYVPPRATAENHGKRIVPGPAHVGDGPIDIDSTLSGAYSGRRSRPARPPPGPMVMSGRGAFAGGPSSQRSSRTQSAAVKKPENQVVQGIQPTTQSQARVVSPDSASVILQLPANLAATVFPKRSQNYSGKIYLTSGSRPSEDMMILAVENKNIDEIRHFISEYDTYMNVSSTGLMLKFTNSGNGFNFYSVEFENASNMSSFIQTLRTLIDRAKLQGGLAISTDMAISTANGTVPSAINTKPSQPASVVSTEATKPPAPKVSKMDVFVEEKTSLSLQEQDERKGVAAPRLREPPAEKQAGATSASRQTVKAPEPAKDIQASAELDCEETPGDGRRTFSSNVDTTVLNPNESPLANNTVPTSKPDEAQSVATSEVPANPGLAVSIRTQPIQAVEAPVQQKQVPFGVSREVIEDIIEWAWDTAKYMRHNTPELMTFDTIRTIIGASCAAVIGRRSPLFRKLGAAEQKSFIDVHVSKQVENGFLEKLGGSETVVNEFENTEIHQTETSQLLPKTQDGAEAQSAAPSKLSGPVYEIEEMIKMRSAAAAIDPGMLPMIPRLPTKASTPQSKPATPRVSVEEQLQRSVVENADWLKKKEIALSVKSPGSSNFDALAEFLSPASGQTSGSPPAGLRNSIHNRGDDHFSGQNTSHLTGDFLNKSIYQKDLQDLITKVASEGNALDDKVAKATEGISRLSLN